ncbi:MAG: class II glutamine amidotransferase [Ignavibacteria bacterium]|nr:class II glutamine amidotransferase [Ignavibacteria bacterium]
MCRLLGLIANRAVDLEFSLSKFKNLSINNPDGWGIGWYENNSPRVFKEGLSAQAKNSKLPYLAKQVYSNIIIAHLRKGTNGSASDENSHPFKLGNWIFAHNGQVDRDSLLLHLNENHQKELKGETDSEVYFYFILQSIDETKDVVRGIKKSIETITQSSFKGLNFLLSDGKYLYAFRYSNNSRNYYSLYLLKREPSRDGPFNVQSKETQALLQSKALNNEKAILVCSEKLTDENWKEINFGSLVIIDQNLNIKNEHII